MKSSYSSFWHERDEETGVVQRSWSRGHRSQRGDKEGPVKGHLSDVDYRNSRRRQRPTLYGNGVRRYRRQVLRVGESFVLRGGEFVGGRSHHVRSGTMDPPHLYRRRCRRKRESRVVPKPRHKDKTETRCLYKYDKSLGSYIKPVKEKYNKLWRPTNVTFGWYVKTDL